MFKLVVLSALVAVAVARPGHISPVKHTVVETQGYAKVGEIVDHVPTAVSHQSSTIIHSKAAVVTPVVAPVVHKTIIAEEPIVHHAVVAETPVHHHNHGEAQVVITVPSEHHDGHYEHHDDGHYEHHDDHHDEHHDNGEYNHHDDDDHHDYDHHDDGHYDNSYEHSAHDGAYEHHNLESVAIASAAPAVAHNIQTVVVASPAHIEHQQIQHYAIVGPSVEYLAGPAVQHGYATHGDGETKAISKSYVAEPDSIRYSEQTHSAPSKVEYVAVAPVVHKQIVSAPIVELVHHAAPEHHQHHW